VKRDLPLANPVGITRALLRVGACNEMISIHNAYVKPILVVHEHRRRRDNNQAIITVLFATMRNPGLAAGSAIPRASAVTTQLDAFPARSRARPRQKRSILGCGWPWPALPPTKHFG